MSPSSSGPGRILLGTAALGQAYGLSARQGRGHVDSEISMACIRHADQVGVAGFDTAPAYGDAERLIGAAGPLQGQLWTKTGWPFEAGPDGWSTGLEQSFRLLRTDALTGLAWHNWKSSLQHDGSFLRFWDGIAADDRIGRRGATTYGVTDAVAAVESGLFDLVQVEWNLLTPQVVMSCAQATGRDRVRLAVRSVLLQGVLTEAGGELPATLAHLQPERRRWQEVANRYHMPLQELALRMALGHPDIDLIVVGVDSLEQIDELVALAARGPLPGAVRDACLAGARAVDGADPRSW